MNKYGVFAMKTWQQLAPQQFAQIEDPNQHFSMLGEQAAAQIADLTRQLEGDDPQGETWQQKVDRLRSARMRAEEMIRADLLTPPPDPETGEWTEANDDEDQWVSPFESMRQTEQELSEALRSPWDDETDPTADQPR